MTKASLTLGPEQVAGDLGAAWDRMAEGRGPYADIYASHAWFSSWLDSLAGGRPRTVIPAVMDGDRPVALLPLVRRGWVWLSAGLKTAPRTRVVLADETPDPDVLAALVDEVGRAGVREVSLYRLPTRDPATALTIEAFRRAGWEVRPFERSTDNVVPVAGNDGPGQVAAQAGEPRTGRASAGSRRTGRWRPATSAVTTGEPMAEGLALADVVQARSWKGPSKPATERQRALFMRRADAAGWAHLAILEIDGRPVAANSFFRIGAVAIGMSTAYEQRLAALSPGFVLHAHVQGQIYGDDPPEVMDMLPGRSPFKDQLAAERPPLVTVEAYRRTPRAGATFDVRRRARWDLPPARARVRAEALERLGRLPAAGPASDPGGAGRGGPAPRGDAGNSSRTCRSATPCSGGWPPSPGAPSAEAAAEHWSPDDRWVRVETADGASRGLVRLGERVVREVVPLVAGTSVDGLVRALVATTGTPLELDAGVDRELVAGEGDLPPLPWTDALLDDPGGKAAECSASSTP